SIDMYSTSWCGVCARARRYMNAHGVHYKDYDVDEDSAARARYHALNPRHSVPTIAIDDMVMVGFSGTAFEDIRDAAAYARLDRAAKNAPKMIEIGPAK